jgi:hypothetical protein
MSSIMVFIQTRIDAPGALQHIIIRGMGKKDIVWQDTAYVLALFGKTVNDARKSDAHYVSKCAGAGRRPELTGGGLICWAGGWRAIREAYEAGIRLTSDERILGSSSFVEQWRRHWQVSAKITTGG